MSYWRYWQLIGVPFAGDSIQNLHRGATVEEALARIEFLISNRRSVGCLIGPSGVGKSSILRHCAQNPPLIAEVPSLQVLRTSLLGMSEGELLRDLGTRLTGSRKLQNTATAWHVLCDYFQAASREDVQTVLLVDDTESSTSAAEADLNRLLSMAFPLTVVFSVESQLSSAVSRILFDRTELQIELPAWELEQTESFLKWAFEQQGRSESIFTPQAIKRIQELSRGVARRIVQLVDLALVAGAVAQVSIVDADCVEQVAWELPKTTAA